MKLATKAQDIEDSIRKWCNAGFYSEYKRKKKNVPKRGDIHTGLIKESYRYVITLTIKGACPIPITIIWPTDTYTE